MAALAQKSINCEKYLFCIVALFYLLRTNIIIQHRKHVRIRSIFKMFLRNIVDKKII